MTADPIARRTVLRGSLSLAVLPLLAACGLSDPESSQPAPSTSASPTPSRQRPLVLMAYFSRAGENYWNGGRKDLTVGNTEVVAATISELVDVDTYRILAADPYPHDYEETVARNVQEQQDEARPQIAGALPDVSGYSTVLLGSPVWNVQEPMILRTFIDSVDLTGKTIHPFVTYAVSGMGRVAQNYERFIPAATISEGLAVRGEEATQARPEIQDWLRAVGLLA